MKKSWYRSKTVWFNALAGIVFVATLFGFTGDFSPEIATQVKTYESLIIIIVNLILRKMTTQPIGK